MKRSHPSRTAPARAPRSRAANPVAEAAPSRRTPLQDRSRQRMERILDAAALLFAEAGYDGATTEAIAERAGTSIGSVYQFFPNKLAIFNAIAVRYVEQVRALFGTFVLPAGSAASLPWYELIERAIDAFAAYHASEPGFRAILLNWRVSADMVLNDDVNRELATRAEQVLAQQAPGLSPARRALVSTMIIETVSAMLILCARRGRAFGDAVIGETKTMLRRYLEPIVTEHARPRSAGKGGPGEAREARKRPRRTAAPRRDRRSADPTSK